ncbi:MAG: hypothetical protein QXG85_07080 [Thermoproteota archaeon]
MNASKYALLPGASAGGLAQLEPSSFVLPACPSSNWALMFFSIISIAL